MSSAIHLFGAPEVVGGAGGFVAISKPAGWRTDGAPEEHGSLLRWLAQAGGRADGVVPEGLLPCHRLDRDTSGVVLCAADPALRALAGGWFERGEVRKTYLALVHGRTHDKGTVDRPLQDPRRRETLRALTRYRTIERLGAYSLLEVRPETGRKHQIRRHLHGLGHPVVGDPRYRSGLAARVHGSPGRLWLHASRIEPPDGRAYEAPLAPELAEHLERLRAAVSGP